MGTFKDAWKKTAKWNPAVAVHDKIYQEGKRAWDGVWDEIAGDSLDAAEKAAERGAELQESQINQIELMEERFTKYYEPQIRQMAGQLEKGPDLEGAASQARNRFGNDYDQSLDSARRQQRRYGMDPTSNQSQRLEEDAAYNRAAGMSRSANIARTEEDDRHWARTMTFANAGSGIPAQVAQMYGGAALGQHNLANMHSQNASAGMGFLGDLAGSAFQAFSGGMGGGAGAAAGSGFASGMAPADYGQDYNFNSNLNAQRDPGSFGMTPSNYGFNSNLNTQRDSGSFGMTPSNYDFNSNMSKPKKNTGLGLKLPGYQPDYKF